MRFAQLLIGLLPLEFFAQPSFEDKTKQNFTSSKTVNPRIATSFSLAEYYLEADQIDSSQKWIETTKELHEAAASDSMSYYIHSLQSELFYYMGLYQFGVHEAEKGLAIAEKLKDSALVADAHFFMGINYFEIKKTITALRSLQKARKFSPKKVYKRLRFIVGDEHIYNNIAQVKIAQQQLDSASWYIQKAYQFAIELKSKRGIPNTLQTQGLIHIEKKRLDSAQYYFKKSNLEAINSNFYDILLINHGYLMKLSANPDEITRLFNDGQQIIIERKVNTAFRQLFYTNALNVFRRINDKDKALLVQDSIIKIEGDTRIIGNEYIQRISNQYVKSENRLLNLKVEKLSRQRNITLLQLIATLLVVVVLTLVVFIFRRKSKLQQTLLKQKNDISNDLHDDIGSGLSSILIHADLLSKIDATNEKQKLLTHKIAVTGKEISQRLSTFIWSLNSENNCGQAFCEYVKQYAGTLFEGTQIDFLYSEDIFYATNRQLDGHLRKQLFYCIKEVLNNSLKHSRATQLRLDIKVTEKKELELRLGDNGIGITRQNDFGNGLKNIRKRITAIGGSFEIKTDVGVEIRLRVPLSAH